MCSYSNSVFKRSPFNLRVILSNSSWDCLECETLLAVTIEKDVPFLLQPEYAANENPLSNGPEISLQIVFYVQTELFFSLLPSFN